MAILNVKYSESDCQAGSIIEAAEKIRAYYRQNYNDEISFGEAVEVLKYRDFVNLREEIKNNAFDVKRRAY